MRVDDLLEGTVPAEAALGERHSRVGRALEAGDGEALNVPVVALSAHNAVTYSSTPERVLSCATHRRFGPSFFDQDALSFAREHGVRCFEREDGEAKEVASA